MRELGMYLPGEACEALNRLLQATSPSKGGVPSSTVYHAIVVLDSASNGPVGRPRLSQATGLGEAPTRTLLQRMEYLSMIEHSRRGYTTSKLGLTILEEIGRILRRVNIEVPGLEDFEGLEASIPGPIDLADVYKVRDYIVMEGCRLVLVGRCEGDKVVFPGAPVEARPLTNCSNGSLIVVVRSECIPRAYTGLTRYIVEEYCKLKS